MMILSYTFFFFFYFSRSKIMPMKHCTGGGLFCSRCTLLIYFCIYRYIFTLGPESPCTKREFYTERKEIIITADCHDTKSSLYKKRSKNNHPDNKNTYPTLRSIIETICWKKIMWSEIFVDAREMDHPNILFRFFFFV